MKNRTYDFDGIIRRKRVLLGETQREFGKRFGVNDAAIGKYENCYLKTPEEIMKFAGMAEWYTLKT